MTCPGCQAGHLWLLGDHVRVSERGVEVLGPCLAPEEALNPAESPFRPRLAAWVKRVNRDCHKAMPLPVATNVPTPHQETEKEREP